VLSSAGAVAADCTELADKELVVAGVGEAKLVQLERSWLLMRCLRV
jgi:hypothetical protein